MSLHSHIVLGKRSPVGRLLSERFSHTRNITLDVNRKLQSASIICPTSPLASYTYGTLGTAIDYRIRYAFAITPSEQLIAWQGAFQLVHSYGIDLLESFFHDLDRILAETQPVGRRLELKEEQHLARFCYVLGLFEQAWRAGSSPFYEPGPLFEPNPKESVQELLTIAQDELIDDLCAMSYLFYDHCGDLLLQPAILNPTFQGSRDVGGADADLIVDGCLIELKTSISPKIRTDWVRQLAGYLLLDYKDAHKITDLGLYMVRQGILFKWPVEEFLQKLTGDPSVSLEVLRRDFYALFKRKAKSTTLGLRPGSYRTEKRRKGNKEQQNARLNITSATDLHEHPKVNPSAPPTARFNPGEMVRHDKFGDGLVLDTKPIGVDDEEVTVIFGTNEKKRLLTSMARLERI